MYQSLYCYMMVRCCAVLMRLRRCQTMIGMLQITDFFFDFAISGGPLFSRWSLGVGLYCEVQCRCFLYGLLLFIVGWLCCRNRSARSVVYSVASVADSAVSDCGSRSHNLSGWNHRVVQLLARFTADIRLQAIAGFRQLKRVSCQYCQRTAITVSKCHTSLSVNALQSLHINFSEHCDKLRMLNIFITLLPCTSWSHENFPID